MNDSGRIRDLPIDEEEAKDLGLHVRMCGQRYNQLVDAINGLRTDIANSRRWQVAIFTALLLSIATGALKSLGVIP